MHLSGSAPKPPPQHAQPPPPRRARAARNLQDDIRTTPKRISVTITQGRLRLGGVELPLPIRGSGRFEVVYLDRDLRIFRSPFPPGQGTLTVQVRQAALAGGRQQQPGR